MRGASDSRFLPILFSVAAVLVLAAGCTGRPVLRPSAAPVTARPGPSDDAGRAAAIAARLSDVDLVGQVLVPFAYGSGATTVSPGSAAGNRQIAGVDTPAEMVSRYRLGGVILVAFSADDPTAGTNPTTNLQSPQQIHALTSGLQAAAGRLPAGLPLIIGTDQEFGVVTRVHTGVAQLPSAMGLGAAHDPALTERAWAAAGGDLAALGINTDFAPDADVLGPSGSSVIGSRSFGGDPAAVSGQVAAAVRGLASAGVLATIKHFPGHGHTSADSHSTLPVLNQSLASLRAGDLPPFAAGITAGAPMVMSGYLDARAVDPDVPAAFSAKVLTGLLRQQMGFGGVVITDAMNMAPAERWSPGESAVRAILAGNDMLLMPPNLAAAQQGLLDALRTGRLPRSRLVDAVRRILTLKLRLARERQPAMSTLDSPGRRAVAAQAAAAAVTVLRGACHGPLVHGTVTVTSSGGRAQQLAWLSAALRARGVPVGPGGMVVHLVGYGDGAGDLNPAAAVTVAMDTPGILAQSRSPTLLATYASTQASMDALAAVLAGRAGAPGRSPVPVPGLPASACA